MSDKKIIKQKIDKYENPKIVNLNENDQEKTMEMCISAKGFKKKRGTLTAAEMKKMLSDFKTEINNNTITMITTFKNEINTNMVTMITTLKNEVKSDIKQVKSEINEIKSNINEVKSDMINMENRINSRIDKMDLKIDNLQTEMNNRFDKLELRVTTLEGFHQADFANN